MLHTLGGVSHLVCDIAHLVSDVLLQEDCNLSVYALAALMSFLRSFSQLSLCRELAGSFLDNVLLNLCSTYLSMDDMHNTLGQEHLGGPIGCSDAWAMHCSDPVEVI